MDLKAYVLKYLLPGIGLILLAFLAGSQHNVVFGFLGFMSFFVFGVVLIIEGKNKTKKEGKSGDGTQEK